MTKIESDDIVNAINQLTDGIENLHKEVLTLREIRIEKKIPWWAITSVSVNTMVIGLLVGLYLS